MTFIDAAWMTNFWRNGSTGNCSRPKCDVGALDFILQIPEEPNIGITRDTAGVVSATDGGGMLAPKPSKIASTSTAMTVPVSASAVDTNGN